MLLLLSHSFNRDQADKLIRHRACFLRDTAYALIKAEMDTDFEDRCRTISADRKKRKDSPSRYAPVPQFIHTASSFSAKGLISYWLLSETIYLLGLAVKTNFLD